MAAYSSLDPVHIPVEDEGTGEGDVEPVSPSQVMSPTDAPESEMAPGVDASERTARMQSIIRSGESADQTLDRLIEEERLRQTTLRREQELALQSASTQSAVAVATGMQMPQSMFTSMDVLQHRQSHPVTLLGPLHPMQTPHGAGDTQDVTMMRQLIANLQERVLEAERQQIQSSRYVTPVATPSPATAASGGQIGGATSSHMIGPSAVSAGAPMPGITTHGMRSTVTSGQYPDLQDMFRFDIPSQGTQGFRPTLQPLNETLQGCMTPATVEMTGSSTRDAEKIIIPPLPPVSGYEQWRFQTSAAIMAAAARPALTVFWLGEVAYSRLSFEALSQTQPAMATMDCRLFNAILVSL